MAFWGMEVAPGKPAPFVPAMDQPAKLHLSQAVLSTEAKPGAKVALAVKVGDGKPLLLCSLREGNTENCGLDLIIDSYAEFSVVGSAAIHLTGYFMPEYELEGPSDEEDGEHPMGQLIGYTDDGLPIYDDEYNSEEDSDYEDHSSDEDPAAILLGSDAEEDYSNDDDNDEESDKDDVPSRRDVVIEEITEEDEKKGATQANGRALPAQAAGGKKQQEFADEGVSGSDEQEESGSEEEGDEGEDESSEEEEEEQAGANAAAAAAVAARKQKQAADKKRKAEAPPAKEAPTKAAKQEAASQQQQQQQQKAKAEKKQAHQAGQLQKDKGGKPKVREFPNGFVIEELKQGPPGGKLAKGGRKVVVKYVGRLKNGKVFDQTMGNKTFAFRLGVGEVIKGWDRGVEGMRVGDKRRLTVPPQMGYGSSGVKGAIPPNSVLDFTVELVDVR